MLEHILAVLSFLAVLVQAIPQTTPAQQGSYTIISTSYSGTGCPAGSIVQVLNVANTGITMTFNAFAVEVGPAVNLTEDRRACTINLGVAVVGSFTMALTTVDTIGYYLLDSRVTAALAFKYQWQGVPIQPVANRNLVGPVTGAMYTYRDQFTTQANSLCQSNLTLTLQTEIALSNAQNPTGGGFVTRDSSDVSRRLRYGVDQKYGIVLTRC